MHKHVLSVVVVAAAFAAAPGSAVARPVTLSCGATITHSVTLAATVDCPAGFRGAGLTIGADDVTLNLNGYGVEQADSGQEPTSVGVRDAGHHFVTISNGGIANFGTDLRLQGGGQSRASGLTLNSEAADPALLVQGGQQFTIAQDYVENQVNTAIEIVNSPETDVAFTRAGTVGGDPVIDVQSSDDEVRGVSTFGEGPGALVAGSGNELLDDQAADTEITSGSGNVVDGGGFGSTMLTGLTIGSAATDTTVEFVLASGAGGDGIDVDSPSTLLVRNSANDNIGHGIDAVPGVTARGNEASGNFTSPQCINVSCS